MLDAPMILHRRKTPSTSILFGFIFFCLPSTDAFVSIPQDPTVGKHWLGAPSSIAREIVVVRSEKAKSNDFAATAVKEEEHAKNIPKSFRPGQQQRRKASNRRPKFYWTNLDNVEIELEDFWSHLGVQKQDKRALLCIPNEALLSYFGRHDLRAAIATHGGRDELVSKLGGQKHATLMPGKWDDAVEQSPELQIVLKNTTLGLSKEVSPWSLPRPQQLQSNNVPNTTTNTNTPKWSHKDGRRPKGYWSSQQTVVLELYDYLDQYQLEFGRPAVWMPRPKELKRQGRDDLKCAIGRFGGTQRIAQLAGLVPFKEWNFFEGQYEVLVLLKEYLDKNPETDDHGRPLYNDSWRYQVFPCVSDIKSRGYDRLYLLIQYYGGRNFLSTRLGMTQKATSTGVNKKRQHFTSWGDFSIEFAIRLCELIRQDHMQVKPPIRNPVICIPTQQRLRRAGEEGAWLHTKVMQYGGYENVARRLYLGYRFQ